MIAAVVEQLIKVVRVAAPVEVVHNGRIQVTELVRITWTASTDGWACTAVVLVGRQVGGDSIRRVGDLTCEQYDPRTASDMPTWLPSLVSHLAPTAADGEVETPDDTSQGTRRGREIEDADLLAQLDGTGGES